MNVAQYFLRSRIRREVQVATIVESQWGVSMSLYKSLEWIYYITVVGFTAYLIEIGMEPFTAVVMALVLIRGPDVIIYFAILTGKIDPDNADHLLESNKFSKYQESKHDSTESEKDER